MTRLIEILISLAIVAALFVIVGIVLPSSRHVSESIETNRKMTIVRDTLNAPRRLKDWSVPALKDPGMAWTFAGPDSGVGAEAKYSSKNTHVGNGSWKLVKSEPTRIEYANAEGPPGGVAYVRSTTLALHGTSVPRETWFHVALVHAAASRQLRLFIDGQQRAVAAVRQWRFSPARRRGEPVDVIVEVAVEFTLR